jgi:hypothetical protein
MLSVDVQLPFSLVHRSLLSYLEPVDNKKTPVLFQQGQALACGTTLIDAITAPSLTECHHTLCR